MLNEIIHEEIENWLVADLHQQLKPDERTCLENHLAHCDACRALQEENKNMDRLLEKTFAQQGPGLGFEERMLRDFRERIPERGNGLIGLLSTLIRLRIT